MTKDQPSPEAQRDLPIGAPAAPRRSAKDPNAVPLAGGLNLQLRRLAQPEAYKLMPAYQVRTGSGGRPKSFPKEFFSAVAVLRYEHPEVRALHRELAGNKVLLAAIWRGVLANGKYNAEKDAFEPWTEDERLRLQAMADALQLPSRSTLRRELTRADRNPLDKLEEINTGIAVKLGYFKASGDSPYADSQTLTADGTVYKSPTKNRHPETVDPKTGEIHKRRIDEGAGNFTEGGGDHVYGSKFSIVSVRALSDLPYGLTLSARPVTNPSPSWEADKVVAQVKSVCERAAKMGVAPSLLVMDGAPDGKHAKRLGENGQGLLAPPKRTRAPKQTSPVERTYSIGTFEVDGTRRQIAMRGTQFLEIINIAGQPHEHVCGQRLKLVRSTTASGAAKQIAYQQLTLHDGTLLRIPYAQMDGRNGRPRENAKEHLKRMSLMRAADKGDENWKVAFGTNRGTAERANGGDDAAMRNRRLPAYGTHNKACWVADRKIAMAIDLLAHRRIESGQASPPAYPDVSGLLAA